MTFNSDIRRSFTEINLMSFATIFTIPPIHNTGYTGYKKKLKTSKY